MLAGDVRGDAEANQIEVVKTEEFSNSVTIKGVDGTTINGEAEFTFEGADAVVSRGFRINMGPGDDSVRLEGVEAEGRTLIFAEPVMILSASINRLSTRSSFTRTPAMTWFHSMTSSPTTMFAFLLWKVTTQSASTSFERLATP